MINRKDKQDIEDISAQLAFFQLTQANCSFPEWTKGGKQDDKKALEHYRNKISLVTKSLELIRGTVYRWLYK